MRNLPSFVSSPDSPVGCSRWDSINVNFWFDTEDRFIIAVTLGRHLDFYAGGGGVGGGDGECCVRAAFTAA